MKKLAFCLMGLSSVSHSHVIDFNRSDIHFYQGRILVNYRITLDSNSEKVSSLLNDYTGFSKLSNLIVRSQLLSVDENGHQKIKQELRPCLLNLCLTINKIQEFINDSSDGAVVAVVVPGKGHFESGFERWKVTSVENGTQIIYEADLTPTIKIPPLIGPLLVRNIIHKEMEQLTKRITDLCD